VELGVAFEPIRGGFGLRFGAKLRGGVAIPLEFLFRRGLVRELRQALDRNDARPVFQRWPEEVEEPPDGAIGASAVPEGDRVAMASDPRGRAAVERVEPHADRLDHRVHDEDRHPTQSSCSIRSRAADRSR
jgi:hypothetical protein